MMTAIREDGQPPEKAWAYLPKIPSDIGLWKPPAGAAPLYRRAADHGHASVTEILRGLDSGTPIIITMCLSPAFYRRIPDGIINAPEPPDPARRHAVVTVGHGKIKSETALLIRNSWGLSWGIDGHAWLTASYLAPKLNGFAEMKEDLTNVPTNIAKKNMRSGVA